VVWDRIASRGLSVYIAIAYLAISTLVFGAAARGKRISAPSIWLLPIASAAFTQEGDSDPRMIGAGVATIVSSVGFVAAAAVLARWQRSRGVS
jgi:hypothetical protein